MKRVLCPKRDNQLSFDETKYPEGKVLAFTCPQCGAQFRTKSGREVVETATGERREVKEPDFSCGYITVIENGFALEQGLPLVIGDNAIDRRNRDTEGVDVLITTNDPSIGRKHCMINVEKNVDGEFVYIVRDFPNSTGTFVGNVLVGEKEQVRIGEGMIVAIGVITFISHSANEREEEE